jgi:polyisoprenoid-binding protein YceI
MRKTARSPAILGGTALATAALACVALTSLAITPRARAAGATGYVSDPAASHLDFIGVQAGAEFKGTFHKFDSTVEFAPDALAAAHIDVQIDLNSLDTKDQDRDKTMRGADIFDIARFPTAHYVTHAITRSATGYTATGALTLHGVTREVPIAFQFTLATQATSAAKLEGTATLKRLDFGVGQGDWKNTEWIADPVKVTFSLALKPTP